MQDAALVVEMLRGMPLFAGLNDSEVRVVAGSLGRRTFGRGVYIFHKDSPGRTMYIIESGKVRIFVVSEMGQEISLNVLGPGDVFGEMAVLDGLPRSAGAVALESTVVLTLRREDLWSHLETCPHLARNVIDVLVSRVRQTTLYVEDLAFLDVNSRVARRLLDLADRFGVRGRGIEIDLQLTQAELAGWVAASRESVNKVLVSFRTRGLISVDGQKIAILDRRRLERQVHY